MKVKLLSKTQNMLDVVYTGARTCYNAGSPIDLFEDIENISDDKKLKLIKSCIESGHDSVLEHTQFTFAIEGVSRSLLAQITRHRISVSFSVQSQRYVNLEDTFDYVIPDALQDEGELQAYFTNAMLQCHENYKELINKLNVDEQNLISKIAFNITITLNSGKAFKAEDIAIEIPNQNLVTEGTVGKEYTDLQNIVFKRIEN